MLKHLLLAASLGLVAGLTTSACHNHGCSHDKCNCAGSHCDCADSHCACEGDACAEAVAADADAAWACNVLFLDDDGDAVAGELLTLPEGDPDQTIGRCLDAATDNMDDASATDASCRCFPLGAG